MAGRPRNGKKYGGRTKGTPNALSARTRDEIWLYAEKKKVNPFEHAVNVLAGEVPEAEFKDVLDCAKDLRSYLMPKPKAIEIDLGERTYKIIQEILQHVALLVQQHVRDERSYNAIIIGLNSLAASTDAANGNTSLTSGTERLLNPQTPKNQ